MNKALAYWDWRGFWCATFDGIFLAMRQQLFRMPVLFISARHPQAVDIHIIGRFNRNPCHFRRQVISIYPIFYRLHLSSAFIYDRGRFDQVFQCQIQNRRSKRTHTTAAHTLVASPRKCCPDSAGCPGVWLM